MKQLSLSHDERDLFEKLCDFKYLKEGFKAVKRNGGSPGIDGVTIKEYGSRLDEELMDLKKELEAWTYKPRPVRRVEIPNMGLKVRSTERLPHWFDIHQWVKVT